MVDGSALFVGLIARGAVEDGHSASFVFGPVGEVLEFWVCWPGNGVLLGVPLLAMWLATQWGRSRWGVAAQSAPDALPPGANFRMVFWAQIGALMLQVLDGVRALSEELELIVTDVPWEDRHDPWESGEGLAMMCYLLVLVLMAVQPFCRAPRSGRRGFTREHGIRLVIVHVLIFISLYLHGCYWVSR